MWGKASWLPTTVTTEEATAKAATAEILLLVSKRLFLSDSIIDIGVDYSEFFEETADSR